LPYLGFIGRVDGSWVQGQASVGQEPDDQVLVLADSLDALSRPVSARGPTPSSSVHICALQRKADVGNDASPEAAIAAIESAAMAHGRLVGTFGR
jgi:hypothetical protein